MQRARKSAPKRADLNHLLAYIVAYSLKYDVRWEMVTRKLHKSLDGCLNSMIKKTPVEAVFSYQHASAPYHSPSTPHS